MSRKCFRENGLKLSISLNVFNLIFIYVIHIRRVIINSTQDTGKCLFQNDISLMGWLLFDLVIGFFKSNKNYYYC